MVDLAELDPTVSDAPAGRPTVEPTRFDELCLLHPDGRVAHASTALVHSVGIEPGSAGGVAFTSWLDPDDESCFSDALADTEAGPVVCRVRVRTAGGGRRACTLLLERVIGTPDGLVSAVLHDDERDERALDDRGLLRRITEAANSTSTTAALFPHVVADLEETMGWRLGRVLPPTTSPEAGWESAAARKARQTATPQWSDNDTDTPSDRAGSAGAAMALPIIAEGTVTAVLEFVGDRSSPPTAERRALLGEIGHQLGSVVERERLAARLDEQTAELERSNEELERFAYVASHDLQEPLRKIVGFSELLERNYDDRLDDVGREYLGYVVDATQRMQQLIRDLLAYSRAGRADPAMVEVDLGDLVAQVLETMEWTLEEASARVTVGSLPTVRGDRNQLAEVLTNLLTNAVKYAAAGGATIAIAAERVQDGEAWEVTVTDDGIGIDPRFAEQIFEVFRRLHGAGEYPGTGIGLAITRRFVEANGGRVWVTPNEPRGSVFHVTLAATSERT